MQNLRQEEMWSKLSYNQPKLQIVGEGLVTNYKLEAGSAVKNEDTAQSSLLNHHLLRLCHPPYMSC